MLAHDEEFETMSSKQQRDSPPPFSSTLSPLVAASVASPSPYKKKNSSMITTRRARPTTPMMMDDSSSQGGGRALLGLSSSSTSSSSNKMTPEAKRLKFHSSTDAAATSTSTTSTAAPREEVTFRIEYPASDTIHAPSKSMLKALLEQVLNNNNDSNCGTTATTTTCGEEALENDQAHLQPAGILSLEQVLLPAVALQEETALKRVQAKIQRDAPAYKSTIEDSRRLIRTSIRKAIEAVQVSRQQRLEQQVVRRQETAELARQERLKKQQERARLRQLDADQRRQEVQQARERRFTALKRQRNKSLYQEIFVLHRSMTRLEKEQRMWKQAQEQQEEWKQKMQSNDVPVVPCDSGAPAAGGSTEEQESSDSSTNKVQVLRDRTETTMHDMVLASKRIQQGLAQVLTILKDSEQTRQQLYKDYHRNHHFEGYQGVRNPRGLIRFLSQED